MLQQILDWDKSLFLMLNSFHNEFWDKTMLTITHSNTWIPFYVIILILIFRFEKWKVAFRKILFMAMAIGVSDYITSGIFKPLFQRLRPCHNPVLFGKMVLVGNCGGQFGFASSHAANTFALAIVVILLFKLRAEIKMLLVFWALLVSYSRVYIGVHFPLDIICGALVGVYMALLMAKIYFHTK